MAETSTIIALVVAFIGVAIMLGIGVQILGGVQVSTNCNTLPGFNSTGRTNGTGQFGSFGSPTSSAPTESAYKFSGWALSCLKNNFAIQNGYTLLLVSVIIIAATVILFVVRLL